MQTFYRVFPSRLPQSLVSQRGSYVIRNAAYQTRNFESSWNERSQDEKPGLPERCINRVTLVGRLGAPPIIKTFPSGDRFASLSIATNEGYQDKTTGENRQKVYWHRVVVHDPFYLPACEHHLRKGSRVLVEGSLHTRKYTSGDGVEKYVCEVVVRKFSGNLLVLGKGPEEMESSEPNTPEESSSPSGLYDRVSGNNAEGGYETYTSYKRE